MGKLVDISGRRGPKPGLKKPKTEKKFASHPLMSFLAAEAQNRGHTPTELAKHLGVGYVYLTQLLNGKKDTAVLNRKILVAAANYLDVPVAEAYLWAGATEPTDFVRETRFVPMAGEIYDVMSRHPEWGGFMPTKKEWSTFTPRARLFVTLAFEKATGVTIIDKEDKTMTKPPAKKN